MSASAGQQPDEKELGAIVASHDLGAGFVRERDLEGHEAEQVFGMEREPVQIDLEIQSNESLAGASSSSAFM